MRRFVVVALVAASALTLAGSARADESTEQARVYFDAGAQAYAAGRYPVAIEAFSNAYRLATRPALLFSMAQAERKQFWIDKKPELIAHAVEHYRAYLAKVPEGGRRDDAATALAELESVQLRLGVSADGSPAVQAPVVTRLLLSSRATNARASIDGDPEVLLPHLADAAPGKHHLALHADGYAPDERDVTILPGVTTPVEINLREQPALLTVQAEAGASALLDGKKVADLPSGAVEAPSGHHVLAVSRNGRQLFQEEVTLERGQPKTVIAPLVVTRQRRISEVVLGVGAATVVLGGAFLGVAGAEQASAESIFGQEQRGNITGSQLSQYNDDVTARSAWRAASIASLGGGAAVLLAGGALFLFDHPAVARRQEKDAPVPAPEIIGPAGCGCTVEVSAVPVLTPGYGGAGLVGTF